MTFSDVTDSSAVVTWTTIRDLPDNTKQYYLYVPEYRLEGESEWTVYRTLAHGPEADDTQHHTLTGLDYNTVYEVQVRSLRTLRGQTVTTEYTPDAKLTTKCKGTMKRDILIKCMSPLYSIKSVATSLQVATTVCPPLRYL